MRTIIAGSRGITDTNILLAALAEIDWEPTVVLCGMAKGADTLGKLWAESLGIPVEEYPADWETYGKAAGFIRNKEMADKAEALIALWDGQSKGTRHMINLAKERKLVVFVGSA
jgi:hypothetical protein